MGLFDLGGGSVLFQWKEIHLFFFIFMHFSRRPNVACSGCGIRRYIYFSIALPPQYFPRTKRLLFCLD